MKKVALLLLAIVFAFMLFSCAAPGAGESGVTIAPGHEHVYDGELQHNATSHFRRCSCGKAGIPEAHVDENKDGFCDVCVFGLEVITCEHQWVEYCDQNTTCAICGGWQWDSIRGHLYEAVVTAPTCKDEGFTTHTCSYCGDVYTDTPVPALGHTPVADSAVAPDCVNTGLTEGSHCSVCEEVIVAQEVVPALGHTVVIDAAVAPTCVNTGLTEGSHCSVCEEVIVAQEVVPALGHTEGMVVVENNVAPDCENAGSYDNVVYCTVCGEELSRKTVTVPALGHTEGTVVVENNVAPDCVNDGSYDNVVYCTVCNEELSRETVTVDALGHTEGTVVVENNVAPDCVNDGSYDNVVYCTVCNEELSRVTVTVDALGHTEGTVVVENNVAPDCVNDGSYDNVVYCTVCNEELSRETVTVDALGHTEVIDSAVAPTCTATGLTEGKHCSVCKEVLKAQETVAALGHTEVLDEAVAPTCTATGLTEGKHCSLCEEVIVAQTVVDALGHDMADATCTKPSTCKRTGCNYTEGEALGHKDENADYKCDACSTKMLPAADSTLTIEQALAVAAVAGTAYTTDKYYVTGIVTNVYNTTYGNMYIKDENGKQLCIYGLYTWDKETRYDKMSYKPIEGDELTVYGILGTYNSTAQMKDAWMDDVVAHEHNYVEGKCSICGAQEIVITNIAEALAASEGTQVELTGTVSGIYQAYNSQFGNISVYITDGIDQILAFRLVGEVKVGDKITVTGVITMYNEKPQIAQGCTFVMIEEHVCAFDPATCTAPATCPVCKATQGDVIEHTYVNGICSVCGAQQPAGTTITASKTVKELIAEYGWTSSTTKQSFNLDDNVSVKINGGSNTGKAYDGDHIRIYATDSPAGTITISVAEGYELVSIKISAKTGTYAFLYVDGESTDISNVNTPISGTSVLLNSVKNGSDGKQVRVTAIEVVYQAIASTPECEHEGGEATCKELAICSKCGEAYGELAAHTWVDATCTAPKTCSVCKATEGEVAAHTYVDGICSVCGAQQPAGTTITASKTMKKLIAEYGWTTSTTKQSFTLDDNVSVKINGGSNTGKAYNGDHIRIYATDSPAGTITISVAEGYELVSIKISAKTGTYAFLCLDDSTIDISNMLTNVSGTSVLVNSVKNGSDGKQVQVTALEVVYQAIVSAPECEHEGGEATCKELAICSKCGEAYGELAAHTWVDATCTAPKTCSACGMVDGEALGHTESIVEAVAPTCTETGLTEGKKCSVCETVLTPQEIVPATGEHTYVNGSCSVCGEEESSSSAFSLTKVTSMDQLVEGAVIVLTYNDKFTMGAISGKYFTSVAFTKTATKVDSNWVTLTLEKSASGNWVLKTKDGKYVASNGNGNYAQAVTSVTNIAEWTITLSDGKLKIQNVALTDRYLQYNASSPRFACYKTSSKQADPEAYIVSGI